MRKRLGKKRWIRSEAATFTDGVWILWNEEDINLRLEVADKFFLHLVVRSTGGFD